MPSALKATLPVGALPVTVAVKVTFPPTADGLAELARPVVLAVLLLTTCDKAALLGAVVGGITAVGCDDTVRRGTEARRAAGRGPSNWRCRSRATALQPLSVVPSTLKATLPVGALPVTVAVKVTFAPKADGLTELARLVVSPSCC